MNYMKVAKHVQDTLGFYNVSVGPQNLSKRSRPAKLLRKKGLPAEALVWVWNFRKDGSTRWIGCFIQNVWLDHGALDPAEVFRTKPTWDVRGDEYTFYRL